MTRPLRIEYPGALYHVMSRGNARQEIFSDDSDRFLFLEVLEKATWYHNILCHAYCLMDNHYHLLLETPEGNLSMAMRDINGNYTQKYNKKNNSVGHLLQGRYKCHLIEKDPYLLQVARYIVLNPVRAKITKDPSDYMWSSFRLTAGLQKSPKWLSTDWILGMFSDQKKESQRKYQKFIYNGIGLNSPLTEIREGIILGTPQFTNAIWNEFSEAEKIKEIKTTDRMINRPSLDDIFAKVKTIKDRNIMINFAYKGTAYTITEIANYLKLHRSTVSKQIKENPNKIQKTDNSRPDPKFDI
ncbi:transposase [Patescibacteria group bacterium]